MRNYIIISIISILFLALLVVGCTGETVVVVEGDGTVVADDFTVVNNTSVSIDEIYMTPSDEVAWGPDLLAEEVLEPGESLLINFLDNDDCVFDIKAAFYESDLEIIIEDFDLCANDTVVFED